MLRRRILLWICAALCGLPLARDAQAQEDDLDALERGELGRPSPQLQAQAAAQPPATTDPQELSVFHHKRGMANYRLGNYPRAIEDLREALRLNMPNRLAPEEWGDRNRIQNDLANAYREGGNWFAYIEFSKGLARESSGRNAYGYHLAQLRLSQGYGALGNLVEAGNAIKRANETLAGLRFARDWGRWGPNTLYLNSNFNAALIAQQGNHVEAERLRRLALDYAQQEAELSKRFFPSGHQKQRANATNVAWAKINLAFALATRNKHGEAEMFARAGLDDQLQLYGFNTVQVSTALRAIGWSKLQQENFDAALRYYRHAITALQGAGVPPHHTGLSFARAALGSALVMRSRWPEALALFEERDRGLRASPEQFKRFGSRHISWALALHKTGRSQEALEMLERIIAWQVSLPVVNSYLVAQARGVLGMALADLGRGAEALQAFRQAIPDLVRRDQDDVASENTGYWRAFWQRVILEAYVATLVTMQQAGAAPASLDVPDEAFRMADLARGSSVQEAISASAARAQLPDGNLAQLVRRDQDAVSRISALNKALGRLAAAAEAERLHKVIADMNAEIARSRREHATLTAEIRGRFPEYAELVDPRPAGLTAVEKALAPDEALVSIYLGETQAYVWTLGTGGRRAFRGVAVARAEIEAEVAKLRRGLGFGDGTTAQIPPFDLATAEKLYRTLLAPDEQLWRDARILNVIPHGALGQIPFGVLVTAAGTGTDYRNAPWLMRKVALAQLPSANALVALRRAPPAKADRRPFVGFGDPVFSADAGAATRRGSVRNLTLAREKDADEERLNSLAQGAHVQAHKPADNAAPSLASAFGNLSALPDTSDELNEIAAALKADAGRDVYLRQRASEKNVKESRIEDRRVVAFATHGVAPGELTGMDQPALVLSNPALTGEKDEDGFLTMEEVLGLKLDADWVVLSACNTASAEGRGSEAVSGLGRAFFYAGARSLLVSNWAVETTSARLLTTELFKRQAENPLLTRAEALRQSALALMQKDATDAAGRTTFSYAHPSFWAPFSLVGDSGAARAPR